MQLTIAVLSQHGRRITLDVDPTRTVADLVRIVTTGYYITVRRPPELYYAGALLDQARTLRSYDAMFGPNAVLHLVLSADDPLLGPPLPPLTVPSSDDDLTIGHAVGSALGPCTLRQRKPIARARGLRSDWIISFSLFGRQPLYLVGAVANAKLAPLVYPGWTCRFYCGPTVSCDVEAALLAEGAQVFRYAAALPGRAGQLTRFLPASEVPAVRLLVRDADSRLNPREAAAVAEWIAAADADSDDLINAWTFHIMHEDMHDQKTVFGGMWGARPIAVLGAAAPPLPELADAVLACLARSDGGGGGDDDDPTRADIYGADMLLLDAAIKPLLNARSAMHHVGGAAAESSSHTTVTPLGTVPRPFPASDYRGFVGQPVVDLECDYAAFATGAGPPSVRREVPGSIVRKLNHAPGVLAALGAFF